jgi:hypothetical protein
MLDVDIRAVGQGRAGPGRRRRRTGPGAPRCSWPPSRRPAGSDARASPTAFGALMPRAVPEFSRRIRRDHLAGSGAGLAGNARPSRGITVRPDILASSRCGTRRRAVCRDAGPDSGGPRHMASGRADVHRQLRALSRLGAIGALSDAQLLERFTSRRGGEGLRGGPSNDRRRRGRGQEGPSPRGDRRRPGRGRGRPGGPTVGRGPALARGQVARPAGHRRRHRQESTGGEDFVAVTARPAPEPDTSPPRSTLLESVSCRLR